MSDDRTNSRPKRPTRRRRPRNQGTTKKASTTESSEQGRSTRAPQRSRSGQRGASNSKGPRPQGQGRGQNQSRPGTGSRSSSARRRRGPRRPLTGAEKVISRYNQLLSQYWIARKKYFELFGRSRVKQLQKVEAQYQRALKELRDYPKTLDEEQLAILNHHVDGLPRDHYYSKESSSQLDKGELKPIEEIRDPHVTTNMHSRDSYQNDTEESVGTMEDYEAYKASRVI